MAVADRRIAMGHSLRAAGAEGLDRPTGRSDSYLLSMSCVAVLAVVALDLFNYLGRGSLDGGSPLRYAILTIPVASVFFVRIMSPSTLIRRRSWPDRLLLLLMGYGLAGALYGKLSLHAQSSALPIFAPMVIGILPLVVTEPVTNEDAARLLQAISLIGFVYVLLHAVVDTGISAAILNADSFRHYKAFLLVLAWMAAWSMRQ